MQQDEARPRDRAELLARIDNSWSALMATIGRLNDDQLSEPHDAAGWAVKDHLGHLAAWERSVVFLLAGRPRHEGLGIDAALYEAGDEDAINAVIQWHERNLPAVTVLTTLRDVHRQLLDALSRLSDADLSRTYAHFLPDEPGEDSGAPIVDSIAGNTYGHFDDHRDWIEELTR